ncbi:MAG TPA: hypothetical protein VHD32_04255 [Candidatus Didemnitutus sp.]|nr:hypothetical protein [Candidatus Didemnitutus sp.]
MNPFLAVAFCVLSAFAWAAEDRPNEYFDPDVQRLIKADMFAFGGVGFVGRISDGEKAFGAIVRKKEAIRFIVAAFEYGGEHARCYALVALRETSPSLFRESIARVRKTPPKKITVMSGCVMSHMKPETVYDAIEAGTYAEWFKHYEERAEQPPKPTSVQAPEPMPHLGR